MLYNHCVLIYFDTAISLLESYLAHGLMNTISIVSRNLVLFVLQFPENCKFNGVVGEAFFQSTERAIDP